MDLSLDVIVLSVGAICVDSDGGAALGGECRSRYRVWTRSRKISVVGPKAHGPSTLGKARAEE